MQTLIDVLRTDFAHTWRDLRRSPGLTLAIVATLALGVGVNAAMFTVLDRILFRQPEGVQRPDEVHRLYRLGRGLAQSGTDQFADMFSAPDLDAMREAAGGVAQVAGFHAAPLRLVGIDADTTSIYVNRVTHDFFDLLGIRPQRGRFFDADEMRYGDPRYVAVLSDALWRRRFGAAAAIVGRTIHLANRLDTTAYTVIGVAASGFAGVDIDADDVWVPYTATRAPSEGSSTWWRARGSMVVSLITRVPAATDARAVEARLTTAMRRVNAGESWFDSGSRAVVAPLVEARGPRYGVNRPRELTLATRLGAMSLVVLVLAIANAAALMLMRSLARQRETAVRVALGVSRARIASRLAVECAVVTVLAASTATLFAFWTGGVLRPLLFSSVHWPHRLIDHRVIVLAAGMTLLASVASSIAPLVLATRTDVMAALKAGGQGAGNPASRLRSTFLAAQTAICVALLAAAGLFVQSLHRAVSTDLGYDPDRLLMAAAYAYRNAPPTDAFDEVERRLVASPDVQVVARSTIGGGGTVGALKLSGRAPIPLQQAPQFNLVDGAWPTAMGLRIRSGRAFTLDEVAANAPVAMINRAMADKYWPGQSALDECLGVMQQECLRVVGVFDDVRYDIAAPAEPYYVLPVTVAPRGAQPALLIRYTRTVTDDDVTRLRAAVVSLVGPTRAQLVFTRVASRMDRQLRPWRIAAALLSVFGIVGLASAAAGVFGLVSYDVGRRTREIGVRTALGATPGRVVRDVLLPSVRVIGAGIVVGIAAALLSGRLMASLLFDTSPSDPAVLAITAIVLSVVAGVAGCVPAIRATRINPVVALQAD
jgi:putative ABC transport system permease protein